MPSPHPETLNPHQMSPNGKLLRTSIQHMFHSQYALPRIHRSIGVTLVHGLRMERALSKRYVVQISLSRASKRPGFCFKQKDILRSKGLKLIQDMPIRYVHLLPLTRILVHRDKLPHEAIPCILGGWVIGTVGIPVSNSYLLPLFSVLLVVPPHHAFTRRLCWWMESVVHFPVWNKILPPNMYPIHSGSCNFSCSRFRQQTSQAGLSQIRPEIHTSQNYPTSYLPVKAIIASKICQMKVKEASPHEAWSGWQMRCLLGDPPWNGLLLPIIILLGWCARQTIPR